MAYPMDARMMSGQTKYHKELEERLAKFEKKAAYLLNYGYQNMISVLDSLVSRNDVIVYDLESHTYIMDGIFLHKAKGGKSIVCPHNDIERYAKMLSFATHNAEETDGEILLVTEGVFAAKIKSKDVKKTYEQFSKKSNINLLKKPETLK